MKEKVKIHSRIQPFRSNLSNKRDEVFRIPLKHKTNTIIIIEGRS